MVEVFISHAYEDLVVGAKEVAHYCHILSMKEKGKPLVVKSPNVEEGLDLAPEVQLIAVEWNSHGRGDVRLTFTPDRQPVYVPVHYSPPL